MNKIVNDILDESKNLSGAFADYISSLEEDSFGSSRDDKSRREILRTLHDLISTQWNDQVIDLTSRLALVASQADTLSDYTRCLSEFRKWYFFAVNNGMDISHIERPSRTEFSIDPYISRRTVEDNLSYNIIRHDDGKATIKPTTRAKTIYGIATRDSIDKTASINVERFIDHQPTGKKVRRSKRYLVHDEFNRVSKGDRVTAIECRPISKNKHFLLINWK